MPSLPDRDATGVHLILGGARSGKSAVAERLAEESGRTPVYLATAQAFDDEMRDKIARHRARRSGHWLERADPFAAADIVRDCAKGQIVLLDCLTMWLTNFLLADRDIAAATEELFAAIDETAASVVMVSNETGQGIVPENALSRRFREAQGILNQRAAAVSDLAILVTAGLPLALKGALPQ